MLRLSAAQIARIDENEIAEFAERLASGYRESDLDFARPLSDRELREKTEGQIRAALHAGLSERRDVMLYVMAALALEPAFPFEMPELFATVTITAIPYEERREAVLDAIVKDRADGGRP